MNHALLLANVASYGAIFDTEDRHLIIDEAHRLEEIMAEAFGARVSYPRVLYVLRQAANAARPPTPRPTPPRWPRSSSSRTSAAVPHACTRALRGPTASSSRRCGSLRSVLAHAPNEEANLLQGMVGGLRRDLESFYTASDDNYAYAVVEKPAGRSRSGKGKTYPELKSWLVEMADAFRVGSAPTVREKRGNAHERHPGLW